MPLHALNIKAKDISSIFYHLLTSDFFLCSAFSDFSLSFSVFLYLFLEWHAWQLNMKRYLEKWEILWSLKCKKSGKEKTSDRARKKESGKTSSSSLMQIFLQQNENERKQNMKKWKREVGFYMHEHRQFITFSLRTRKGRKSDKKRQKSGDEPPAKKERSQHEQSRESRSESRKWNPIGKQKDSFLFTPTEIPSLRTLFLYIFFLRLLFVRM